MQNYKSVYKQQAVDNVTYAVFSTIKSVFLFSTIKSVFRSLDKCLSLNNESMKERILRCYLKRLSLNPNAFRPKNFTIEKFISNGAVLIATIPSEKKFYCNRKINE